MSCYIFSTEFSLSNCTIDVFCPKHFAKANMFTLFRHRNTKFSAGTPLRTAGTAVRIPGAVLANLHVAKLIVPSS